MKDRPNLLIICCDQLRYDSVGFNGENYALRGRVQTPRLDALAAESAVFDRAFCSLPSCCPARQSMLTGKRPEALGALWNYNSTCKTGSITPACPTWTAAFRAAGYRMGYVGKWHASPDYDPRCFGYEDYYSDGDYDAWRRENYPNQSPAPGWFGATDPLPTECAKTHVFAGKAVELLRTYSAEGKPWHLRLDFPEPHLPCCPTAEFAARYRAEDILLWPSFDETFADKPYIQHQMLYSWKNENKTREDWAEYLARYFAIITQMDDAVGRVLDALEACGEKENTVVLFTADHGDMAGSHRMMDKHYVLYDDIVHVPLLLRIPGKEPRRVAGFVNNSLDMGVSVCELCGVTAPEGMGRSLVPAALGDESGLRDCAVSSFNGQQFGLYTLRMYRDAHWKYIWNPLDTDELYDLDHDPWELTNRAHDPACAELVREMRKKLYDVLLVEDYDLVHCSWMRNQLLENEKI